MYLYTFHKKIGSADKAGATAIAVTSPEKIVSRIPSPTHFELKIQTYEKNAITLNRVINATAN